MVKIRHVALALLGFIVPLFAHKVSWADHLYVLVGDASSYLIERAKPKDTYAPMRAIDGNMNTAWAEGVEGPGIGEQIQFDIGVYKATKAISILPGFAASGALFKANNRPKQIRMVFYDVRRASGSRPYPGVKFSSERMQREGFKAVMSFVVTLKDEPKFQTFDIPPDVHARFFADNRLFPVLMLVIESVYPGSKHDDTCISEIRLLDSDGDDLLELERRNVEPEKK